MKNKKKDEDTLFSQYRSAAEELQRCCMEFGDSCA